MKKWKQKESIIIKKSQNKHETNKQKAKSYLLQIQERIMNQLDQQIINIPPKKKELFNTQTDYLNNPENIDQNIQSRIKRINQQKEQTKQALHQLQLEQKMFKAKLNKDIMKTKKNQLDRSHVSQKGLIYMKNLKKQYAEKNKKRQQFAKSLHHKDQSLQLQELEQAKKKENRQKRKSQIQMKLLLMKNKREQRLKKYGEQKKLLIKLKKQKKLYEELQERWEESHKNHQHMKKQIYQQMKQKQKVDIQSLKQHQIKYCQNLEKSRTIKSHQNNFLIDKHNDHRIEKSKFYRKIVDEVHKKKKERSLKYQNIIQLSQKKKQYSKQVKMYHSPSIRSKTQYNEQQKNNKRKNILNTLEVRKQGLQYLSISKSLASKKAHQMPTFSEIDLASPKIYKYPDYLTQSKKVKQNSVSKITTQNSKQTNFDRQLKQAKKVMKKTTYSQQQKYQKIRILDEKISVPSIKDKQNNKHQVMMKKIAAKMQILQSIK